MYNIYIRKFMIFCLTKKFMTFLFHLFDLVSVECWISNLKKIDMQQATKVSSIAQGTTVNILQ